MGWGSTVREINSLAPAFTEIVHVAPLHEGASPASAESYDAPNIRFRPVVAAGGDEWVDKIAVLAAYPEYARAIREEVSAADVVHVRCPANIAMLALILLALRQTPTRRWFKYAGRWGGGGNTSWMSSVQRAWLRAGLSGGVVTVNGTWPNQVAHVHSLPNPCLTKDELREARRRAAQKEFHEPIRLLFVGRLETEKGVDTVLQTAAELSACGRSVCLELAGDGPSRPAYETMVREFGIEKCTVFHGWLSWEALAERYARAHFVLLPSRSEGWPKVLGEGMAFGAVPLASAVGSIPEMLGKYGVGRAIDLDEEHGFVEAVRAYDSARWRTEARRAAAEAEQFTYENYVRDIRELLEIHYS